MKKKEIKTIILSFVLLVLEFFALYRFVDTTNILLVIITLVFAIFCIINFATTVRYCWRKLVEKKVKTQTKRRINDV